MSRVVGVGCRASAGKSSLIEAIERALVAAPGPLDTLATSADRAGTTSVLAAAKHFGLRVVPVDLSDMRGVATSTQSERILSKFGVGSLSEAVALTVAGGNARLLSPREISSDRMATAAIAEGDRT